ncbi:MAG TPA: hypothetical protein VFE58_12405 [Tepidisphaeraceae bacterium]|nr:hypothetical protein [Tepidisphaeraceae bacterium]
MKNPLIFKCSYLIVFVLSHAAIGQVAGSYKISSIGGIPDNGFYVPTDINSSGEVVGFLDGRPMQAFIFSKTGMTSLSTFGESASLAYGINDSGEVTGYSSVASTGVPQHAFLYSNGAMIDLGSLGNESFGQAINNNGQIAGYYTIADGTNYHAFLYSNGTMTDIGVLPGTADTQAAGVNDSGEVVGESYLSGGYNYHAFVYVDGTMTDLGTLGGEISSASAINNAGQIVGKASLGVLATYFNSHSSLSIDEAHAFLYSSGTMTDLGTLGGYQSQADAINNLGQIVGESDITPGSYAEHAFLYFDGTMIDLNSLIDPATGWVLNEATGINDRGQIIGNGMYDGQQEAFLLTPSGVVPEPTIYGVFMLGVFGVRRRRWGWGG